MAEKGQTSSITSVTEDEMSADSESDTTESSYSNITSSVLSSTDTDDKLTPGLINISISKFPDEMNRASKRRKFHQEEADGAQDNKLEESLSEADEQNNNGETTSHNSGRQPAISMPGNTFPYGSHPLPLPLKSIKEKQTKFKSLSLHPRMSHHQASSFVECKSRTFQGNLTTDDNHSKFSSTDISETSSTEVCRERNNNHELGEEDTDKNDSMTSENQQRPFAPDLSSPTWYQAQCFDRYWTHYRFVMEWYHLHVQAVRTLKAEMFGECGYQRWGYTPQPQQAKGRRGKRFRQSRRARQKKRKQSESSSFSARGQGEVSHVRPEQNAAGQCKEISNKGSDDDDLEMEITDDMLDFFATSFKHKLERDKAGEQDPVFSAPTERPGVRRTEEMKELYGAGAPMIQGMETAMQMTFDRFLDRFQPSLWPNMPLKINFAK